MDRSTEYKCYASGASFIAQLKAVDRERWLDIDNFAGYQLSSYGNVRRRYSPTSKYKPVELHNNTRNYPRVYLYKDYRTEAANKKKQRYLPFVFEFSVHKLVYKMFVEPTERPSPWAEPTIHHIDGNKLNSYWLNLIMIERDEHNAIHDTLRTSKGPLLQLGLLTHVANRLRQRG